MEVETSKQLLMAFYGDDFTGSTDALESLNKFGIKTMLFIDVPTPQQLEKYPNLQAIGIAGMSRTLSPGQMENTLKPIFKALAALHLKHVHYKVCSTFDSSPTTGSIGKAIDLGVEVFKTRTVPLLVAAPVLGRYCLFGNLFARMGIGSEGKIYRLDRHPSMRKHPITPAGESDLRLHLAQQTNKNIGLFDILALEKFQEQPFTIDFGNNEIVLFDALKQDELATIGQIIDSQSNGIPLFSAGSSGIGMALGAYWQQQKKVHVPQEWQSTKANNAILVASGSCSAVTSEQLNYAIKEGFEAIAINTLSLVHEIEDGFNENSTFILREAEKYAQQLSSLISAGKNVIVHTSLGNNDPRVSTTNAVFKQKGLDKAATAKLYGSLLGEIVKLVAEQSPVQRIIIAGGDTSSYAARAMGIESVEMIAPFSLGAPICKANAPGSAVDGLQVIFKGGQVGKPSFFVELKN